MTFGFGDWVALSAIFLVVACLVWRKPISVAVVTALRGLNAKIDTRFTALADRTSELMGYWQASAVAMLSILGWAAMGPSFHFSDAWQLAINTPTTIAELFIGFLLGSAANRSERRHREQLDRIERKLDDLQEAVAQWPK